MARKRGGGSEEEGGNWMDTYGDMVTLILTFFVLLYSMSSIDKEKFQYIAQAFASMGNVINTVVAGENKVDNPTGNLIEEAQLNAGEVPENFDQLYQYIQSFVEKKGLSGSVELEKGASNVTLKFRDNIFFSGDSGVLLQEGKDLLTGISPGIQAVDKYILAIKVNGHTAESQYSKVNEWDLSSGRANAVVKFLQDLNISQKNKYSAQGFGKYRPVTTNDTEENRRQNRRVEIIIIRNDADFTNPQVIQELLQIDYGKDIVIPSTIDGGQVSEVSETAAPTTEASVQTDAASAAE